MPAPITSVEGPALDLLHHLLHYLLGALSLLDLLLFFIAGNLVLDLFLQFVHELRIIFNQLLHRITSLAKLVAIVGEP